MRERTFETGPRGLGLCLCEWGEPAGDTPPLLVLHGFLEQGAAWDAVARSLDRHVIAPDQRGHGRSEHVGRGGFYHFMDYVADVDALVEHLGGQVDLVGHSMGGTVACYFAGARPEKVRRLVLVEGLGPPDQRDAPVERLKTHLDHRLSLPQHRPVDGIEAAARRIRGYNPGIPEDTARLLAERGLNKDRTTWGWDPLHRARNGRPFTTKLFDPFLSAIACPVLLVDGADSSFVFPDLERRRTLLRDARRRVIAGAGHLVHHDQPEALAHAIEEFVHG